MKKTIVIEVLLGIAFAVLLYGTIMGFQYAHKMIEICSAFDKDLSIYESLVSYYSDSTNIILSYAVPALIAAVATLSAMVIIALYNFPCFKPLVDKLTAKLAPGKEQRAQREAKRTAAKAEQAKIAKQERIAALQAELDELKKDE